MGRSVEEVLASLGERDVLGGAYPDGASSQELRRRWNQAQLIALGLHYLYEPGMLPGEYSQSRYMLASSIYRQDRAEFPTGTEDDLALDVAEALARGWL